MRWPGRSPVSAVFTQCSVVERQGGFAARAGGSAAASVRFGGAMGVRVGAGPTGSGAEWNAVKSRRVRRSGAGQVP